MRQLLATAGLALALSATPAAADEMKGAITEIDHAEGSITVGGETFYLSEDTYGVSLDELATGDHVIVIYLPVQVQDTYDAIYVKALDGRTNR
jgi:hypothetical protein